MSEAAPGFGGVLETVLYYEPAQREPVERFYSEILGLRAVARWGDGMAYRVGAGVLLLFDTEKLGQRTEAHSRHGAKGAGHTCLTAAAVCFPKIPSAAPASKPRCTRSRCRRFTW